MAVNRILQKTDLTKSSISFPFHTLKKTLKPLIVMFIGNIPINGCEDVERTCLIIADCTVPTICLCLLWQPLMNSKVKIE